MTYTVTDYKSGAEVKRAFAAGVKIEVFQPGMFGSSVRDGTVYLEGPHYPKSHTWYLSAIVENSYIIKIKK